jgi:hypothetical protein
MGDGRAGFDTGCQGRLWRFRASSSPRCTQISLKVYLYLIECSAFI